MNIIRSRGAHLFKQLFDTESWTYSYLLGCLVKKEAVLIDPVDTQVERDMKLLREFDLELKYAEQELIRVNTHCHADHITGSGILKTMTKCNSMIGAKSGAKADILLNDGDEITYGEQKLEAVSTPGHTDGCLSFINHSQRFVLTGDALLIRACGRTDFQQGDPRVLYNSVHNHLFTLPDDFYVYPGHDYKGHTRSTIWEEKTHNPRLTKSEEEFVDVMKNLGLAYPNKIDEAIPWNIKCGPSQLGQVVRMDGG